MKLRFLNIILAAGVLLTASCSNDDGCGTKSDRLVAFKVEANRLSTKSVTEIDNEGKYKTTFQEGDEIGVYAVRRASDGTATLLASGNYANNVKYVRGSDGKWTSENPIPYPKGGDVLDFYAYYPYSTAVADATAVSFSVVADQSGDTGEKSDLMLSENKTGNLPADNTVTLKFYHKMSLVQLTVVGQEEGMNLTDNLSKVVLKNVVADAAADLSTGTVTEGTDKVEIVMRKTDDGSNIAEATYWALVPAQALADGTELFAITYDGKGSFIYTLNQEVTLAGDYVKQFKVTVGQQTLEVINPGNTNIEEWNPGADDNISVE